MTKSGAVGVGDRESGVDRRAAWRMLAALAAAEFLGMTLWFSATAAAPALVAEFRLDSSQTAWLTMAVQGGFVCGTLLSAFLNLPDVVNARWLFAIGCAMGAIANGAVTFATAPIYAMLLRFATGVMLAFVYPPGMKIAASWFRDNRGVALGIIVGALTVGSAFPHLLAWLTVTVDWRTLMMIASACSISGGLLCLLVVRDGPYLAATAPFNPRAIGQIFANRRVRLATFGYLGHMWELYAMWTWIATFAAASLASRTGSLVAFVAIASGAVGCVAAGAVADRVGKARIAAAAMIISAACCALAGFTFGAGIGVLLTLAVIWGVAIVADSALFSALIAEYSLRDYVGTALTLQMCGGFLLTLATIRLTPIVAAWIGWQWAFLLLAPGPALGTLAMLQLDRGSLNEPTT
jgi:MFS family permease